MLYRRREQARSHSCFVYDLNPLFTGRIFTLVAEQEQGTVMFDIRTFPKADAVRQAAQLSHDDYQRLYRESIEHPGTFWAEQATRFLDWSIPLGHRPALGPEDR